MLHSIIWRSYAEVRFANVRLAYLTRNPDIWTDSFRDQLRRYLCQILEGTG